MRVRGQGEPSHLKLRGVEYVLPRSASTYYAEYVQSSFIGIMARKRSEASANSEYDRGIRDFPKTGRNVTFEPAGGMVTDLSSEEGRARFFDKFTKGGEPVYLIGATNNTGGDFNEYTRRAYVTLKMEGRNALLGQWTDPDGNRFRDAGFAVSGISFRQALTLKACSNNKRYWR